MRAVVFDLDGTLVDSAPAIQAIARRFLSTLGLPGLSLDETRVFVGNGVRVFLARALAARGAAAAGAEYEAHLSRFQYFYDTAPAEENLPYPGVEAALTSLQGEGLALGLCTNKPMAPTRAVLAAHGWAGRFGAVVTGDSLPEIKPDPAPLLHAASVLGAGPGDLLYVGDSEVDAETARAARVPFALYLGGYRRGPVEAMGAAFAFDEWEALVQFVLGARRL